MSRKRSLPIIVVYVASLVVTIALLVSWIVYVLQSVSTINQLAGRLGSGERDLPLGRADRRLRPRGSPHRRPHLPARPGAQRAQLFAEAGGVRLQHHPRDEVAGGRHQASRADAARHRRDARRRQPLGRLHPAAGDPHGDARGQCAREQPPRRAEEGDARAAGRTGALLCRATSTTCGDRWRAGGSASRSMSRPKRSSSAAPMRSIAS